MTTFQAGDITLHRVREHVWEIEQEGDMRVPARIFASESLLEEIADDKTLQQLRNTTHLPGIQQYAICMPDGHQGYGFPVGGVAGIDAEHGCISPGAIGYDINCLPAGTEVLLEHGRSVPIESLTGRFERDRAMVVGDRCEPADIRLMTETSGSNVYAIRTEAGDVIKATGGHPLSTPDGKRPVDDLEVGDEVFVRQFDGVRDESPEAFVVLDETDFADEDPQLVDVLTERDLLPLRSTDDAFSRLLKLVGFHTGDGSMGPQGQTWFFGDTVDLEAVQDDIEAIGFTPSRIYERERHHTVNDYAFSRTEYSVKSGSRAFQALLKRLGAPDSPKVTSSFSIPDYFDRLTDWQRALYLSAYFGAEMSAPASQHRMNLQCPTISQTRRPDVADRGVAYYEELADALGGLGIATQPVERFETTAASDGPRERIRLAIRNDSDNLIRFFTTVGYRYNHAKQQGAVLAAEYLKRKEEVIRHRSEAAAEASARADGGYDPTVVTDWYDVNERFVERSIYGGRATRPRPPRSFPSFEAFVDETEVGDNLSISSRIASVTPLGERPVYDLGVDHEAHTFVADGFVVSNCGVRMVKTNLQYEDVQGREEELVDALYDAVPCGLGAGGIVETDVDTIDEILERGPAWAVENGYGVEHDLLTTEDEGQRPEADPTKVSHKAKQRGKNQVGSLGSGNHFLEVQRVTDVFDEPVADAYGLEPGQVVVLIHCGSRGLGHQVCTEYLRKIEQRHQGLLQQLPDRELAAAPAGSQLADDYYGAMCAAINYAWTNRHLIMHQVRMVFEDVFGRDWEDLGMDHLYDVAHNIGKKEVHVVDGEERELYVHRKGATRAFPAGRPEVPREYRDVGQPVIIPGSMGTGSYVLCGGEESMKISFGSTAHGAGRLMSRTQAKQEFWGGDVQRDLREQQQIYVKAESGATVAEEAPGVYKDVDEVVRVSSELGIGTPVVRVLPICNIKG